MIYIFFSADNQQNLCLRLTMEQKSGDLKKISLFTFSGYLWSSDCSLVGEMAFNCTVRG